MKYAEMLKEVLNIFGNDDYNVKLALEEEIDHTIYDGMSSFIFEMYDKRIEIQRELIFLNNDFEENWSIKEL